MIDRSKSSNESPKVYRCLDRELIGGTELTYSMSSYRRIAGIRKMYDESIELCGVPALKHKMSLAVGIWADVGLWSDTDISVNADTKAVHIPIPALGPSFGVAPSGT